MSRAFSSRVPSWRGSPQEPCAASGGSCDRYRCVPCVHRKLCRRFERLALDHPMKVLDPLTGNTVHLYIDPTGKVVNLEMARMAMIAKRNAEALLAKNKADDVPTFDSYDGEFTQFDFGDPNEVA